MKQNKTKQHKTNTTPTQKQHKNNTETKEKRKEKRKGKEVINMKNTYIDEVYHTYIEDEFSFEEELYNLLNDVEEE